MVSPESYQMAHQLRALLDLKISFKSLKSKLIRIVSRPAGQPGPNGEKGKDGLPSIPGAQDKF
jgi:hypothetical protein